MKFRTIIVTAIAALIILPSSASAWWYKDRTTLIDKAIEVNEEVVPGAFDTLLTLVTSQRGVFWRLDSRLNTTVFAPTDDAFDELFTFVEDNLCLTPDQYPAWYIRDVLNYHLARGTQDSGEVFGSSKQRMIFGGYLFPDADNLTLTDNLSTSLGAPPANIVAPYFDVEADNGVIHVIDRVLIPYLPPSNCE